MRVLHAITGLETGGAENMLYKVLAASDREPGDVVVVSLTGRGTFGPRIEQLGIPVHCLGISPCRPGTSGMLQFVRIWRAFQPDVVQGWMYHANLASSIAGMLAATGTPVLWSVRQSVYALEREKPVTRVVIRLGAKVSGRAGAIIYNSETAARQHEKIGYCPGRTVIIPNGFDCRRFRPGNRGRERIRGLLQIPCHAVLIGLIARYHPVKAHGDFLRAAGQLAGGKKNVFFALAGSGVDHRNDSLRRQIADNGLEGRVFLLGERDSRHLLPALDIAALASESESFSNAIGEAMACAVPVVVTEVGDARRIVGKGGLVVPAGDPAAMANALATLISAGRPGREEIGRAGRERVKALFSIEQIAGRYRQLYAGVLAGKIEGGGPCAE